MRQKKRRNLGKASNNYINGTKHIERDNNKQNRKDGIDGEGERMRHTL